MRRLVAAHRNVYAVTLRAKAEMVVWVEASSRAEAKGLAEDGSYDTMSEWSPVDYGSVRATKALLSEWPPDHVED